MNTLLLRIVGPLQAWGVQSNHKDRDTGREPSKSGIIGLLCAALGRDRSEPIEDLSALKIGVRVDREGERLRDYHTAGKTGFWRAKGGVEDKDVIVSTRWYLADAAFWVGIESESLSQLKELHDALNNPRWPLCLGRKACVPSIPVWWSNGLKPDTPLRAALEVAPWLGRNWQRQHPSRLRLMLEDNDNGELLRNDWPLSFKHGERKYMPRRVTTGYCQTPNEILEVA